MAGLVALPSILPASVRAQGEPRFGDSTWVAPYPSSPPESLTSLEEGPRVADSEHERTWETALRTPFRIVFYPLRLVARGTEQMAAWASPFIPTERHTVDWVGLRVAPAFRFSGSTGPGAGVKLRGRAGRRSRSSLSATWTTKDTRRVRLRSSVTEREFPIGVGIDGIYEYRPNRRFYGIGNGTSIDDRTIFLRRELGVAGTVYVGSDSLRRVRGVVGISDIEVGPGYSDGERAQDVFSPAEVPFLTEGSDVFSFGVGGDLGVLDRIHDPSLGLHLRGEVKRVESYDANDLRYDAWHAEARGYLPVFASRRVIALRYVYQGTQPRSGTDPVPFYRLPESADGVRFAAYKSHRFVDQQLMLGHAEYRWIIWENVWAHLFGQWGQVAPSSDAFRFEDVHGSTGFGARAWLGASTMGRVDIGWGDEGVAVYLDLKGDF